MRSSYSPFSIWLWAHDKDKNGTIGNVSVLNKRLI